MTIGRVAVVVWAVFAAAPAAQAAPAVTETILYYGIKGATPHELRLQMSQLGPTDFADGKRYDANTRWFVNWRYNYASTARGCSISAAYTTVKITITLPRFQNSAAPAALRQAFGAYVKNLLVHEKGHAQTAIDVARKIEDRLAAMPPEPDCARMGKAADALGFSLIKEANRLDAEYDVRTEHGRTQGARFP